MRISAQKYLDKAKQGRQRKQVFGSEYLRGAVPHRLQFLAASTIEFLEDVISEFDLPAYTLRVGVIRGFEGDDYSGPGQVEVFFDSVTESGVRLHASIFVPYRAGDLFRPSVIKIADQYELFLPENFAALFSQLATNRPYLNKNMYAPDKAIVHVPTQLVSPFTVPEMVSLEPYIDYMYIQDREVPR